MSTVKLLQYMRPGNTHLNFTFEGKNESEVLMVGSKMAHTYAKAKDKFYKNQNEILIN